MRGKVLGGNKVILLLSGGVDSICAWRLLGLPQAVNFDLGTVPTQKEHGSLSWASDHFGKTYIQRDLNMANHEKKNGYVDFRNALLILAAAQIDSNVALAAVAEWAPDKNTRFYRRLERAVNRSGVSASFNCKLRVHAPFAAESKGELLARYKAKFGSEETRLVLENTWSCYRHEDQHCGECGGCRQRYAAERQMHKLTGMRPVTQFSGVPGEWVTPALDRARWLFDNGWLGYRQMRAHRLQDAALTL